MIQLTQSSYMQMQEQIRNLKLLVKAYDNYLQEIMPEVYKHYPKVAQLRERARQEKIDIKEPPHNESISKISSEGM